MHDLLELEPNNLKFMQKLGDLYNLAGQNTEAVNMYFSVAEKYMKDNYLLKAMALFKSIVRLDPAFKSESTLSAFYSIKKLQKKIKKEEGAYTMQQDDFEYPVITRAMAEDIIEEAPEVSDMAKMKGAKSVVRTLEDVNIDIEASLQRTIDVESKQEDTVYKDVMEKMETSLEVSIDDLMAGKEKKGKSTLIIPLFKDLEPLEFEEILEKLIVKTYLKDEVILKQGESGNSMFFITSGKVKVTYIDQQGVFHELAILDDIDFFGEFTLFTAKTRHATVTAITNVELLELSLYDLRELVRKHPNLSKTLYQFYRERVLETFLTLSSIFGQCDIVGRRVLAKKVMVKKYEPNSNIFIEGEISPHIFYIKRGKIDLLARTPTEMQILVTEARSDGIIGELQPNTPDNFSAVAIEDSELLIFDKEDFIDFLERYPKIQTILKEITSKRIHEKNTLLKSFFDGISG